MKKFIFPIGMLFLGLTLFLSSCEEAVKDLARFEVNYDLPTVSFDLDSLNFKSNEVVLAQQSINANIDSILEANNVSGGTLENAQFTKVTVTITSPESATFDFIENMRVSVALSADFSDEVQVAETGTIEEGSNSVDFIFDNMDMSPYMSASMFHARLYGELNGPVPFGIVGMQWLSSVVVTIQPLD